MKSTTVEPTSNKPTTSYGLSNCSLQEEGSWPKDILTWMEEISDQEKTE